MAQTFGNRMAIGQDFQEAFSEFSCVFLGLLVGRGEAERRERVGDVVNCDKRPLPHLGGCMVIWSRRKSIINTVARTFHVDKRVLALIAGISPLFLHSMLVYSDGPIFVAGRNSNRFKSLWQTPYVHFSIAQKGDLGAATRILYETQVSPLIKFLLQLGID